MSLCPLIPVANKSINPRRFVLVLIMRFDKSLTGVRAFHSGKWSQKEKASGPVIVSEFHEIDWDNQGKLFAIIGDSF